MRIRILGGGWYGCHIAKYLIDRRYDVALFESSDRLFDGASANNPARLHLGFHYPRSQATRELSLYNFFDFMDEYGDFTRQPPVNIYAVAAHDSFVDFGNYKKVLRDDVDFIEIERPSEFGLQNVEGAVLTGERHILVNRVRDHFVAALGDAVHLGVGDVDLHDPGWDWTVDCTFSRLDRTGIDRYEPCLTFLLEGDYDKALTIMDGPFPSIYPHYEDGVVSLTSAKYTPLARCKTAEEARAWLDDLTDVEIHERAEEILASMSRFYPAVNDYRFLDCLRAVRAMPRSGADSRIYGIDVEDRMIRIRAGKIDAVFGAARDVARVLIQ